MKKSPYEKTFGFCVPLWRKPTLLAFFLLVRLGAVHSEAQLYWKIDGTTATWTSSSWGSSTAGPFSTGYTANTAAVFSANSLITFITNTNVGNVSVINGSNVTMTAAGTLATSGTVRTLDVGAGSILDFAAQDISTSGGTGFIKNGDGIFFTSNGNSYTGGFTLNAGTIIIGGVNAMGNGGALAINGGTIAANINRNITTRYSSVTIGGDFTLGGVTTGVATGNGSASATITFADNMGLGTATRAITVGSNANYTLNGILSGALNTGLTVNAASGALGSLVLGGANSFSGDTTVSSNAKLTLSTTGTIAGSSAVAINGGTLLINSTVTAGSGRIKDNAGVTLGGAATQSKLEFGATTITETAGTLTLSAGVGARVIDFGASGNGTLTFDTITAVSSLPLQIWNWNGITSSGGGADRLVVGSLAGSVALSDISFYSGSGSGPYLGATVFAAGGELVPVPEVGALFGALGLLAPLAYRERRHWMRCREARI